MTPLIGASTTLTYLFVVYFAALFVAFVFASPLVRAYMVLLAIYTAGIQVDIGIAFYPSRVLGILGGIAFLLDRSPQKQAFLQMFRGRILILVAYVICVSMIGAMGMPDIENEMGGFRSKEWRPMVAITTHMLTLPLIWIVYRGLENRVSIDRFFMAWCVIALGSCFLAFIQQASFLAGKPIWGIFREIAPIATHSIAGKNFQRVSALAGEPKGLAISLVFALILFMALDRSFKHTPYYRWRSVVIGILAFTILFTFSSGAFIALVMVLTLSSFQQSLSLKVFSLIAFVGIATLMVAAPDYATELYETRIQRFFDKITNSQKLATGSASVEQASDDKDNAAAAYLMMHPESMIMGLGIGPPPYYYNHLVVRKWREKLQEPNSGITWVLISIGIVGIALFVFQFWDLILGRSVPIANRQTITALTIALFAAMISVRPFDWIALFLALSATPAWWIAGPQLPYAYSYKAP